MNILICVGGCVYRCLGEYSACICRGVHAHVCIYMMWKPVVSVWCYSTRHFLRYFFLKPSLSVGPEAFSLPLAG